MIVQTPVFAGPPHLVHIIIIKQPFFGQELQWMSIFSSKLWFKWVSAQKCKIILYTHPEDQGCACARVLVQLTVVLFIASTVTVLYTWTQFQQVKIGT